MPFVKQGPHGMKATVANSKEIDDLKLSILELREMVANRDTAIQLYQRQKQEVLNLVTKHGMCQGAESKQWVIDQAMRLLLGPAYGQWRQNYEHATDKDGELYPLWDDGIPP